LLIVERPNDVSGSNVDDAKGEDDVRFVDDRHDVLICGNRAVIMSIAIGVSTCKKSKND